MMTARLQELVRELENARSRLLAEVSGLSQEELDERPGPGSWSPGEILHHLELMELQVTRIVEKQLQRATHAGLGPDLGGESLVHSLDAHSVAVARDKFAAPASVAPAPGMSRRQLLDGLASSRAGLLEALEKGSTRDLGSLDFPHPVLGRIGTWQWILYLAQHEQRHTAQIRAAVSRGLGAAVSRGLGAAGSPRALLEDSARRAIGYLEGLEERSVAPRPRAVENLAGFDEPLPEKPVAPHHVLAQLDALGSPASMAMAGPRFFGFVIGGSLPVTVGASWLATAWDQNSAYFNSSPGTAAVEQAALRWLLDLLGLPAGCGAGFVTGATMANFTALAAARHAVLARAGWNVEADGLFGAPPVTVIVSAEAHPTLFKSLGMLGLGRSRVVRVPVDGQGRMVPTLPRIDGPAILCTQAGNVNTGAFDPVGILCRAAHEAGAWVHVDGAFGLWALASPAQRHLAAGIEEADSWATDAHKWLNVPYDCGLAFSRDAAALHAAMAITAEYLPNAATGGAHAPGAPRNPSDYTPELSRRARGVEVWAALKTLGREGVGALVQRCCDHAKSFASGLRDAGFTILNEVALNQVLVSFGDAETTNRVISRIQEDGTCWCGTTVWQGKTAMRISVSSWATTGADVRKSLDAMIRIAREEGAR
jgi:glutamate/tyrosine decarboxylase-like PLP-dependent enzyme